MRHLFIATKNLELPDYLLILLKEISAESFGKCAQPSKADLIIVDTETIFPEELKTLADVPILLFCYEVKPLLLHYTKALEINGLFCLNMSSTELNLTLSAALIGDIHYNEKMIGLLFSNSANEAIERVLQLTEREREIIKLMKQDLTNEEIADQFKLSVRTINAHKGNIMRKMETKTTSGLFQLLYEYDPSFKR